MCVTIKVFTWSAVKTLKVINSTIEPIVESVGTIVESFIESIIHYSSRSNGLNHSIYYLLLTPNYANQLLIGGKEKEKTKKKREQLQ